jgi:phage tail-like protein
MIRGVTRGQKFYQKYAFVVEIDGLNYFGFQDCSELSAEIAKIEHFEGGSSIPDKEPGRVSFADITLNRGATDDEEMYDWFTTVLSVPTKKSFHIVQQDRAGTELRRWNVRNAFPVKYAASMGWDNNADENVLESVTLTFDYFELNVG